MHKAALVCALLFLVLLAWIIYLADTGQQSLFFDFAGAIPYGDKIGHFFIFGLLTLLINLACHHKTFPLRWLQNRRIYPGSVLVLLGALIEEASQALVPNRSFEFGDILADILGIVAFTVLGHFFLSHIEKPK